MTKEGQRFSIVIPCCVLISLGITLFFSPGPPVAVVGITPLPASQPSPFFLHKGCLYPKVLEGTASWYGHMEEGNKTANGEVFYRAGFTAATNSLPMGVFAKVTNLENGRWCLVWINDRGPFIKGRILDVSEAVAKHLRMHHRGLSKVRIKAMEAV